MQQRKPKLYVISHKNKPSYPTKSSKKNLSRFSSAIKTPIAFTSLRVKTVPKWAVF